MSNAKTQNEFSYERKSTVSTITITKIKKIKSDQTIEQLLKIKE